MTSPRLTARAILVDPRPLDLGAGLDCSAPGAQSLLRAQPGPLTEIEARLSRDGQEYSVGRGGDVLGHPLLPLVWLAHTLHEHGSSLRAGQTVLTGSFCAAVPLRAGSHIRADYGAYGALDIECV